MNIVMESCGPNPRTYSKAEYDALHAEAEALRAALLGIASVNPAELGIEWAKSYASDGLNGAGSELYARWLDTFKEAEALRAENGRLRADYDNAAEDAMDAAREANRLRTDLEAARGLLESFRRAAMPVIRLHLDNVSVHPCDEQNDRVRANECSPKIRALYDALTATPAPEVQAEQGERQEASQDVRALVSADDVRDACANAVSVFTEVANADQCREVAEYMREVLLAQIAHRQAQPQ